MNRYLAYRVQPTGRYRLVGPAKPSDRTNLPEQVVLLLEDRHWQPVVSLDKLDKMKVEE